MCVAKNVLLQCPRDPLVVVAWRYHCGLALELIHPVAHGDAQAGAGEHGQVVEVVADGHDVLTFDLQPGEYQRKSAALVRLRRKDAEGMQ